MQASDQNPKLPKNYRIVFEVLCAQAPGAHADAGAIYAEARRRQSGIGYSTVYRALDRLRDSGLIHEVRVPGTASALYEVARHGHAHFLCTACGQVEDIDYAIPSADIASLRATHDIAVTGVALTFNGLCKTCRDCGRP